MAAMNVTDLTEQVKAWLRSKDQPMTQTAAELGVSYFWLQRFLKDQMQNMTTKRLQFLVTRMQAEQRPKGKTTPPRISA